VTLWESLRERRNSREPTGTAINVVMASTGVMRLLNIIKLTFVIHKPLSRSR